MHAVVSAVITAAAQLLEQALGRAAFPLGQLGFLLQDSGQNLDPLAKLGRWLNPALVLELGLLATNDLTHRSARHPQRAHDLLDRPVLFEKGAPDLADHVHANHPPNTLPSRPRPKGRDTDTQRQRGSGLDAKNAPQGVTIARDFTAGEMRTHGF